MYVTGSAGCKKLCNPKLYYVMKKCKKLGSMVVLFWYQPLFYSKSCHFAKPSNLLTKPGTYGCLKTSKSGKSNLEALRFEGKVFAIRDWKFNYRAVASWGFHFLHQLGILLICSCNTIIEQIQFGIGFIDSPTQTFRVVYFRKIYEKLNCVC